MVDFTTPNLCGASEQFNKLASQFDSIKDTLQGSLEAEIDTLNSTLTSSLNVLSNDMKGLIPELPSIPDVSLVSEIQNLISLPVGSPASLISLANIESKFRDSLNEVGFSLESIVSDAREALSGGIDLCGGGIPNFVIAQNGEPTQTADSVGMAEGDPVEEEDATLLTPSENIVPVNTSINFDASVSKLALVELVEEIENLIASEGGRITNAVKEEFDKADVIAKAKSEKAGAATSPAVAKIATSIVAITASKPVLKPQEVSEEVKILQDKIASLVNLVNKSYEKLLNLLLKSMSDHPHNLIADGKRRVVNNNKTITIQQLKLKSEGGNLDDSVNKSMSLPQTMDFFQKLRRRTIRDTDRLDSLARDAITGEVTVKKFEDAINERLAPNSEKFVTMAEQAFVEAEKVFTVESDE